MYVVTDANDDLVAGPTSWVRPVQTMFGLAGNASPPVRPYTSGGLTLRDVEDPPLGAYQVRSSGSVVGDVWLRAAQDMDLPTAKAAAKEALAARRYEAETGGTVVNSMVIETDRDTQSILTAARIRAKEDAAYTVNWKTSSGFVALDATTVIAIADAVATHVQNCFDKEKQLTDEIDTAVDVAALRNIDIEAGW